MDKNEKKRLRAHVGEHLDISGARLTDDEAEQLADFVDNYDEFRGRSDTRTSTHVGWSSEGKYTREETYTDTFTHDVGIRTDYSYQDDDGQTGESSNNVTDARGVLNWLNDRRRK
ncbi:hypothetical protein [Subtercola sp. RTI3]|uniref:hypothetical protein n=1 Tax=Subtercola sp. RTI3 TaxID=3048639 RepID=UPI002B233DA0|nr:hypothetical protein [Subtercola sp. RTI3]MEA9986070.1 hypothetical protein [Subtercola sp. RTI3]